MRIVLSFATGICRGLVNAVETQLFAACLVCGEQGVEFAFELRWRPWLGHYLAQKLVGAVIPDLQAAREVIYAVGVFHARDDAIVLRGKLGPVPPQ